jgi:hypothetical protein
MIDIEKEELLSLSKAAEELKVSRRAIATSTLYRWTSSGCRGILLEFVQIGGVRCTTKAALTRFFDSVKDVRRTRATSASLSKTSTKARAARRERAAKEAARAVGPRKG